MRENSAIRERLRKRVGLEEIWRQGAAVERLSPSGMFLHLSREAVRSVFASPFTSLMTLLTIVFSLFLFSTFVLVVENVGSFLEETQTELSMSIFLREGTGIADISRLENLVRKESAVRDVQQRSKTQALESFRKSLGVDSPLLDGLDKENPLPASLEVTFQGVAQSESEIERLGEVTSRDPAVEHVEYSRGLLNRIAAALRTIKTIGSIGVAAMLVLTGFIIMIAIRLALYAHREEIEIMYLVGATRWFVRAPYMVEGFLQGLAGSVCSLVILYLTFTTMQGSLGNGAVVSLFFSNLSFLSAGSMVMVILLGVIVGVAGSFAAVRKFLISIG